MQDKNSRCLVFELTSTEEVRHPTMNRRLGLAMSPQETLDGCVQDAQLCGKT